MKGPYQRLKYDLRRLWECPVCGRRVHSAGTVTAVLCDCQQQADPATRRFMRLVELAPRRDPVVPPAAAGDGAPTADS